MLPSDIQPPDSLESTHLHKATVKTLQKWMISSDNSCLILSGARGTGKSLVAKILSCHVPNTRVFRYNYTDTRSASDVRGALRCFCQSVSSGINDSILLSDDIHVLSDSEQTAISQAVEEFQPKLRLICTSTCTSRIIPELLCKATIVHVKRPSIAFLKRLVSRAVPEKKLISAKQLDKLCCLTGASFSNLFSALDKLTILGAPLGDDDIHDACSAVDLQLCGEFMRACEAGDLAQGISILRSLLGRGIAPEDVLASMGQYLQDEPPGHLVRAEEALMAAINFHARCNCATTALYRLALALYGMTEKQ